MIESENKRVEWYVGLFVLLGLLMLGTLILMFGRFDTRSKYDLTVRFQEAGVFPNAPVRLGGAKVGVVSAVPKLTEDYKSVLVKLKIYDGIRIPRGSKFTVNREGLLGDAFVSITPPAKIETKDGLSPFLEPGNEEVIAGFDAAGLDDLQESAASISEKAENAITELRKTLTTLNTAVDRFNTEFLTEDNLENFSESLTNFKESTEKISKAGDRLEPLLTEAQGAMTKAGAAMDKTNRVMDTLEPTISGLKPAVEKIPVLIDDLHPAITDLRDTVKSTNTFIGNLQNSEGLLQALMHDTKLKDDFTAILANVRERGILRYKDVSGESPREKIQPKRKRIITFGR